MKLTGRAAYAVSCDMFGTVLATANRQLPEPTPDGVVPVAGTVRVVRSLVKHLARRLPSLDAVGLSLGGPVADRRTVVEATFLGWHDIDLAELLEIEVEVPVSVTNDVAALTREQLWFGAGRTHSTFWCDHGRGRTRARSRTRRTRRGKPDRQRSSVCPHPDDASGPR